MRALPLAQAGYSTTGCCHWVLPRWLAPCIVTQAVCLRPMPVLGVRQSCSCDGCQQPFCNQSIVANIQKPAQHCKDEADEEIRRQVTLAQGTHEGKPQSPDQAREAGVKHDGAA